MKTLRWLAVGELRIKGSPHYSDLCPLSLAQREITYWLLGDSSLAFHRKKVSLMEKQRNGNNSSTSGTENLKGRKSDHNDRGASNKVLPFSIEAILSAPHPKKERMPVTRKRPHSSAQEHSAADWSPLTTLEDFTSSNLPEDAAKPENAETGKILI